MPTPWRAQPLGILGQPPALKNFCDNLSKTRIQGYKPQECEIVSPRVTGQGAQPTAAPTRAATDSAAILTSVLVAPWPIWLLSPCTVLVGNLSSRPGCRDTGDSGPHMRQTFHPFVSPPSPNLALSHLWGAQGGLKNWFIDHPNAGICLQCLAAAYTPTGQPTSGETGDPQSAAQARQEATLETMA